MVVVYSHVFSLPPHLLFSNLIMLFGFIYKSRCGGLSVSRLTRKLLAGQALDNGLHGLDFVAYNQHFIVEKRIDEGRFRGTGSATPGFKDAQVLILDNHISENGCRVNDFHDASRGEERAQVLGDISLP